MKDAIIITFIFIKMWEILKIHYNRVLQGVHKKPNDSLKSILMKTSMSTMNVFQMTSFSNLRW